MASQDWAKAPEHFCVFSWFLRCPGGKSEAKNSQMVTKSHWFFLPNDSCLASLKQDQASTALPRCLVPRDMVALSSMTLPWCLKAGVSMKGKELLKHRG